MIRCLGGHSVESIVKRTLPRQCVKVAARERGEHADQHIGGYLLLLEHMLGWLWDLKVVLFARAQRVVAGLDHGLVVVVRHGGLRRFCCCADL